MLQNNVEDLQSEKYRSQKTAKAATAQLLTKAQVISYRAAGTPGRPPPAAPRPWCRPGYWTGFLALSGPQLSQPPPEEANLCPFSDCDTEQRGGYILLFLLHRMRLPQITTLLTFSLHSALCSNAQL